MKEYTISESEDGSRAVAKPPVGSPVQVPTKWAEWEGEDDAHGRWEEIIGEFFRTALETEEFDVSEENEILLSSDRSAKILAETEYADSEDSAAALLYFLDEKEIISIEGDQIAILQSREIEGLDAATEEEGIEVSQQDLRMLSNWATLFATVSGEIETAKERVENANEKLKSRQDSTNPEELKDQYRSKRKKWMQQMVNAAGGKDPDELGAEQYQEFRRAREMKAHYENLVENIGESPPDTNPLGPMIEKIDTLKDFLDLQQETTREEIATKRIYPSTVLESIDNLEEILSSVTDYKKKGEAFESTSDLEDLEAARAELQDEDTDDIEEITSQGNSEESINRQQN